MQRKHYDELTVMSGIAIVFVLAIHGCGSALKSFHPGSATYADAGVWLRAVSNFVAPAVPMFLFVSGFKYAANDAQTPYFVFLKKRLPRVLMSFAIINTLFWVLDSIKYMESFDIILLVKTYIHSWVGYSVAYQLWYIPMYCCVITACPIMRRWIPSTAVRFCLFAMIGIVQRALEADIPVLATYPIRFISYPVFFEMGALAQEKQWGERISTATGLSVGGTYFLAILLFSRIFPEFSVNGLVKYGLYYFAGTAAMYILSVAVKSNSILHWLGTLSYPVFLLHEPLIGRSVSLLLGKIYTHYEICYVVNWIIIVSAITLTIVGLLKKLQIDRLLWNFCVPCIQDRGKVL